MYVLRFNCRVSLYNWSPFITAHGLSDIWNNNCISGNNAQMHANTGACMHANNACSTKNQTLAFNSWLCMSVQNKATTFYTCINLSFFLRPSIDLRLFVHNIFLNYLRQTLNTHATFTKQSHWLSCLWPFS